MPRTTRNCLVGDVITMILKRPDQPLWIAHDPGRRRYAAFGEVPRGRLRTQIGPYSCETPLWKVREEVETAVRDLNNRDATRYEGTQEEGGIAEAFASVWGKRA
jgi:hypothetical protein